MTITSKPFETSGASSKHIKTLIRRYNFLKVRVNGIDEDSQSYDKAELSALYWTLNRMEDYSYGGSTNGKLNKFLEDNRERHING